MESERAPNLTRRISKLAVELRPELHRYCSRLMGSVIDGEDVVQDVFAKALVDPSAFPDLRSLRPWLFRIAHNRAIDVLRSRGVRITEAIEAAQEIADQVSSDPVAMWIEREAVHTAVVRFAELPVQQRSVILLKDVLDEPLADIARLLDLSIDAVKGHLARGRARLRQINASVPPEVNGRAPSAVVARYVALFNDKDWDALRALLAEDVQLVQSGHPERSGAQDVGLFFTIYAKVEGVRLEPAWLDNREVIAVFEQDGSKPHHFMWLTWHGGKISRIRDYRYVPYVLVDAELRFGGLPTDREQ